MNQHVQKRVLYGNIRMYFIIVRKNEIFFSKIYNLVFTDYKAVFWSLQYHSYCL